MKLLEWMRKQNVADDELAKMIGGYSSHAVRKWKHGERIPLADVILKIEEITKRQVTLRDFVGQGRAA